MGVQLGEAFHEESLERAALLLAYDERVRDLVLIVLALVAAGAANAAVPTPDPVKTGFAVPSRNMVCNAGPYRGGNVVACTIFSQASARGQKIWSMQSRGRVSVGFLQSNAQPRSFRS
jgi:hypothetical protein